MKSKVCLTKKEFLLGIVYIIVFFLLARNCSLIFIKGTFESIYARLSEVLSVVIFLYFIVKKSYAKEIRNHKIKILIKKDLVLYVSFLFFGYLLVREIFSPLINIYDLFSIYYPIFAIGCFISIATETHPKIFMYSYLIYGYIELCINIIDGVLFRDLSELYSTKFFFIGPRNQFTVFSAVLVAVVCCLCKTKIKHSYLLRCSLAVILIVNSIIMKSTTTLICTVLLCLVLLLPVLEKRLQKKYTYIFSGLSYVCVWLAVVVFKVQNLFADLIFKIFHKSATFTSRTEIWDVVFDKIKEHFIFGFGKTEDGNIFEIQGWKDGVYQNVKYSAHNQVLQELYYYGIISIIGYAVIFVVSFRNRNNSFSILMCLFIVLINCIVEAPGMYSFFFLCFLGFYSDRLFENKENM